METVKDFIVKNKADEFEIIGPNFRRNITLNDTIKTLKDFAELKVKSYDKIPINWEIGDKGKKIITKWRVILYV